MPDEDGIPSFHDIVERELGVTGEEVRPLHPPLAGPETLATLLPHYQDWQLLGAGGMGIVYKAWHKELRRWAAIKFLSPSYGSDPRALARFQNEATLLAQLQHLNIVSIHDFGADGDLAWLVMDFVDGVPLSQWCQQVERSEKDIARLMAKVVRAAGAAHAAGIIHRDLKPANILVIGDEPVILDFGLAHGGEWKHDFRLTQAGEFAGTVSYLAPEQVDAALGETSPATDVHACGVILFELLSGRLPREGPAVQVINRLAKEERPPRLLSAAPQVNVKLDAVCWCAMQRKPEDRYANGLSMAQDLERFLAGRTVQARTPDLLDRLYAFARRYPWVLGATFLAVVALAIAAWSAVRLRWSEERSRLLARINREMSAPDWDEARLNSLLGMLKEMHRLDTVLERQIREDLVKRVRTEAGDLLEEPRLGQKQTQSLNSFFGFLTGLNDSASRKLMARWVERENSWRPILSLQTPMEQAELEAVFKPGAWRLDKGRLQSAPVQRESWSTLYSRRLLQGAAILEAEYGHGWQQAKALGMTLIVPQVQNLRFYVFQADRFDRHLPGFHNPDRLPVAAILSEMTPLAFATLPSEAAESPELHLACRYESGELTFTVNRALSLHHARLFDLVRPLSGAHFSVLLPAECSIHRLNVNERGQLEAAPPFSKADEFMNAGRVQEALTIYESYLHRDDLHHECRYKYAACLEVLGRRRDAQQSWEKVAGSRSHPWSKLAMFQLWRTCLADGDTEKANAWFDLLAARGFDKHLLQIIPTADRILLNQYYLPYTRSLNCLKASPEQLANLDRAVQVQVLLGANAGQQALRNAMAFHFAGHDQRARQMYAHPVLAVRPSPALPEETLLQTLLCMDQWASLGRADSDALLQPAITAWLHHLNGSSHPARAIPFLEDLRHELRLGMAFNGDHKQTLEELIADPRLMLRHQVEAWLLKGVAAADPEARQQAWQQAVARLDAPPEKDDQTQQRLHAEFVARSLVGGWTPASAADWLTSLVGKSTPVVSGISWSSPFIQALVSAGLDQKLNHALQSPRGQAFARAYILRTQSARELAREAMCLILTAMLPSTDARPDTEKFTEQLARQMMEAYCSGSLEEISLMQLLKAAAEGRPPPNWSVAREALPAGLAKNFDRLWRMSAPKAEPDAPLPLKAGDMPDNS